MRTYGIAQGTLLSALWWPECEENPKKEGIYVYIWLTHFAVQQKLIQHCETTTLRWKRERKTSHLDLKRKFILKSYWDTWEPFEMPGYLRNVPFLENSAVFNISKKDRVRGGRGSQRGRRGSQSYHRSWKFKVNLMPSLLFNFLLKHLYQVGKKLNWLI